MVGIFASSGALVTDSTLPITLGLDYNPAGGTLLCEPATCTKTASGGTATFDTLSIATVGTYTFGASSGLLPGGESGYFAITPAPPTGLLAPTYLRSTLQTVTATGEQQLAWDYTQGSPLATGFRVYVDTGCDGGFALRPGMPVSVATLTHTHSGLALGSTTCWRVTAIDASAAESAPSNTVSWTVPDTPPGPTELTVNGSSAFFLAR